MNTRQQFTAARHYLRTEPSLFNPRPAEISTELWRAAKATMFKAETNWNWTGRYCGRKVVEWIKVSPRVTYGCHCKSCLFTNRHARTKFAKWPCDEPKGKRASEGEYRSHVAHLWEGVIRSEPPVFRLPGRVAPVQPNATAIRWNAGRGRKYVEPVVQPIVEKPTMLSLARELRQQARRERSQLRRAA